MSLQDCAKALGISENTLKYHLKRTQENFKKHGTIIIKTGRGNNAVYEIKRIEE